jgi:hypothetical protein
LGSVVLAAPGGGSARWHLPGSAAGLEIQRSAGWRNGSPFRNFEVLIPPHRHSLHFPRRVRWRGRRAELRSEGARVGHRHDTPSCC